MVWMAQPTTIGVKVEKAIRDRLKALGRAKDRSPHWLVKKAIDEYLVREEQWEAEKRDEEARVWLSGIEAVQEKMGVKLVYDLSATPFFLRGSGWSESRS